MNGKESYQVARTELLTRVREAEPKVTLSGPGNIVRVYDPKKTDDVSLFLVFEPEIKDKKLKDPYTGRVASVAVSEIQTIKCSLPERVHRCGADGINPVELVKSVSRRLTLMREAL